MRAVSKAELHERLWPATFVSEANLASLVAEVRRALGDQSREPKYIRTVHGFGYALVGRPADARCAGKGGRMCWAIVDGREIPLVPGEHIVGRDPEASIMLDAPSVSRRHARIVVGVDSVTLEDLTSKNGTFLNDVTVEGMTHAVRISMKRVLDPFRPRSVCSAAATPRRRSADSERPVSRRRRT